MPNWCLNRLEIIGSKKQLNKIINIIENDNINNTKKDKMINLTSFIEKPKNIDNYDFYGTKWIKELYLHSMKNIDIYNKEKDIYYIYLTFDTANGPLNKSFLTKFSEKFNVSLILRYIELEMNFYGAAIVYQNKYHDFFKFTFHDSEFCEKVDNDEFDFISWASKKLESIYIDLKEVVNFNL